MLTNHQIDAICNRYDSLINTFSNIRQVAIQANDDGLQRQMYANMNAWRQERDKLIAKKTHPGMLIRVSSEDINAGYYDCFWIKGTVATAALVRVADELHNYLRRDLKVTSIKVDYLDAKPLDSKELELEL